MQKVLIIDDFDPFRGMARRVLSRLGYRVLEAPDGRQGLEIFDREQPDVVITDLRMPGLDGSQVLAEIKQKSPDTEVVVLTGFATERTEHDLLKQGAFVCLRKPFNLEQIVKVLDRIREKGGVGDPRPVALVHVEGDRRRLFLDRVLRKNGLEPRFPESPEEARRLLRSGELDFLLWEVSNASLSDAKALVEARESLADLAVVPLLVDAGPDVEAFREALGVAPADCLKEPLDEESLSALFRRLLLRLLTRRNELYKQQKAAAVGTVSLQFGAGGELVADFRGRGRQFLYTLTSALKDFPWPFMVLSAAWDVVYVSDRLKALCGFAPEKIDLHLWDALNRKGLSLPPLDDLYRHLARTIRRETGGADTVLSPEGGGLGLLALRALPETQGDGGLVALLFPDAPGPAVIDVRPAGDRPALPPPLL